MIVRILSILFLFGIWCILSIIAPLGIVPTPFFIVSQVVKLLISSFFYYQFFFTLTRILISLLSALIVGFLISFAMMKSKILENFIGTIVSVGLLIPAVVISFVMVIIFGSGQMTPICTIFLVVVPQVTTIIFSGMKNINLEYKKIIKIYNISNLQYFTEVVFPQMIPTIFVACKNGLSTAWKIAVIVEAFTITNGIGYQIYTNFNLFYLEGVFSWTVAFIGVMFGFELLVMNKLELALLRWKHN